MLALSLLMGAGAAFAAAPENIVATTSSPDAATGAPPATAMPSFSSLVERLRPTVVSVYVDGELAITDSPPVAEDQEEDRPRRARRSSSSFASSATVRASQRSTCAHRARVSS
jgi:hypothetical protein